LMSLSLCVSAAAQTLQSSQADFSRGQALIIAKKPADAAERFEAVTRAEPDFAPGWYALGAARRRAGQCEPAIAAYRRYAQMLPNEPEPYYGLGLCLKETGQLASASQALRRYVDLEKRPSSQKWVDHARSVIEEIGNGADAPKPSAGNGVSPEAKGPAPATGAPEAPPPTARRPLFTRSRSNCATRATSRSRSPSSRKPSRPTRGTWWRARLWVSCC
jgi:hypothetical protein